MTVHFSWLTILLLVLGWLTHWLVAVKKARKAAMAAKTTQPSLFDYWRGDRYTTLLSVVSLVAFYFVVPYLAGQLPLLAQAIGATEDDPLNPLAAYLGGVFSPWMADLAGKRIAAMVGDESKP
jgi:Na+/proline symporter